MTFLMGITLAVSRVTYRRDPASPPFATTSRPLAANEKAARFAGIKVQKTKVHRLHRRRLPFTGFAAFINAIKVGSSHHRRRQHA